MENKELWEKCVEFHGHECGGLTIGYKASLYAMELLQVKSPAVYDEDKKIFFDEDIVCISENDACGVDAVQVLLGCSVGKGNLLFHIRGKQAFSFYDRKTGKSVRLVLKPKPDGMTREESFEYYKSCSSKEMFDVKEATIKLPEKARIFDSYVCDACDESTGSNWIRLSEEKKLCLDCYSTYDRFNI